MFMWFIIIHLLSASLFYLGSRAEITRWLWSRYPSPLAKLADCASCSGFWFGAGFGVVGLIWLPEQTYLDLPFSTPYMPLLIGLISIVLTPYIAALQQYSLWYLGDAAVEGDEAVAAPRDSDDEEAV